MVKNIKSNFVKDGNIKFVYQLFLGGIGIALIFLPAFVTMVYEWKVFSISLGAVVGAIGGYSAKADALRIKPFDNSYKKAKQSYQSNGEKKSQE